MKESYFKQKSVKDLNDSDDTVETEMYKEEFRKLEKFNNQINNEKDIRNKKQNNREKEYDKFSENGFNASSLEYLNTINKSSYNTIFSFKNCNFNNQSNYNYDNKFADKKFNNRNENDFNNNKFYSFNHEYEMGSKIQQQKGSFTKKNEFMQSDSNYNLYNINDKSVIDIYHKVFFYFR